MPTATVSNKGWVVIPKKLREKYHLTPGAKVEITDQNGGVLIIPIPENPVEALHGLLAEGPSLTEDLLAERRREREREEEKANAHLRAG